MSRLSERLVYCLETQGQVYFSTLASSVLLREISQDDLLFINGDPKPLVFGATGNTAKLDSYALATGVSNSAKLILPPGLALRGYEEPDFADAADVAKSKVEEVIANLRAAVGRRKTLLFVSKDGESLHTRKGQDVIIMAGDVVHFGVGGGQLINSQEREKDEEYNRLRGVYPLRPQTNLSRNMNEVTGEKLAMVVSHLQQTFSQQSTILAWDVALAMGRYSPTTGRTARISTCDRYVALFGEIPPEIIKQVFEDSMPDPLKINSRIGLIEHPLLVPYLRCLVRINQNGLIDGCGPVDGCEDPRAYFNDFGSAQLDPNLLREAQVAIIGNVPGRFVELLRQTPTYNGWRTI